MKTKNYWICNDSQGIYLYCGLKAPVLVDNIFTSREENYDWVDAYILDAIGIDYPKNLNTGVCIPIKLKVKSKW